MSLAREVAEAYISVDGDIKRFRDALRTKGRKAAEDAGETLGDDFNKKFGEELAKGEKFQALRDKHTFDGIEADFRRIAKAAQDGNWDKFWKDFSGDADAARTRIKHVTKVMNDFGRVTRKDLEDVNDSFDEFLRLTKEAASFDSARLRQQIKALRKDFDDLSKVSTSDDFRSFFRNFNNDAIRARARLEEVIKKHREWGTMTDDNAARLRRLFKTYSQKIEWDKQFEGLEKAAKSTRKLTVEVEKSERRVGSFRRTIQSLGRVSGAVIKKMRNSWARMDSTVRLVLTLIAVAAGPAAAMLSALGSTAVSMVSSVGMAMGSLAALGGVAVAGAGGIALLITSFDKMKASFPGIERGLNRITARWKEWENSFVQFAGPGVSRLLNNLATELGRVDFGAPIGQAMGGISSAFAHVVNSSGFQALMKAFTREYPRALRGIGAGFASVFGALSSLLAGAAPLAERLGYSFREWSRGLYASAEAARQNGQMQKVFDLAGRSLQSVLRLVRALGNLLGAVFMATADHGNALLDTLSGIINGFAEWIRSADGIQRINLWLETANKLLGPMGNLIGATGRALASLVTPATIELAENFLNIMAEWIPKLAQMLVAVSKLDILGNLAHLLNTVSTAMEPMIPTITELAQTMGTFLRDAITAVGPLISGMARAWEPLVNVMLNVAQFVVPLVIGAIDFVANAFNALPQPIQSATTALIVIGGMWGTWTGLLMKAAAPFKAVIQNFRNFGAALTTLGGHIMTAARMIGTVLPKAVMILFNLIRAHPIGMLITAIGAAVGALTWFFTSTETGQRIWQGFMDALSTVWAVVGPKIQTAFDSITSTLQTFWDWIQNIGQTFPSTLQAMVGSAGEGANGIISRFQPLINFVRDTLGGAFEEARAIIAPALQDVMDAAAPLAPMFAEAGQQIVQALQPLVQMIIGEVLPLAIELYATWSSMWMQVVAEVLPAVMQIIQALLPLITTILGQLIPAFTQVLRAVVPVVTTFISQLVPVITQVIATILPLVTTIISQLVPAFIAIATIVIGVSAQIIAAILPVVAQVIAAFLQLVTFVIGILVPVIQEILKIVVVVFEAIVPIIQGALNVVMGIMNTVMSLIKGDWQGVWDGIKQVLQGVWDVITGVVSGAIAIVSQVIQSTMTLIAAAWSAVWNAIKSVTSSVWNGIKSVISTVINGIKSTISTVWNAIKSFISTTMNNISTTFRTIWNAIKLVITNNVNNIRSTISTVWNAIKSFISTTMNNIRDTFSRIWTVIKTVITSNVNNIRNTIQSIWNAIKSFISLVMNGIRNTFSSIWNAIRNTISNVLNGIRAVITFVWNGIRNIISSVMNGIRNTISSIWNGIRNTISIVVNAIRNAVSIGFNGARNAGVNAFNFMRNAVSNTINGLLNIVRNAANGIKNAFSSIVGSMATIGRDIIQGVINGVSSMGNALYNAALNVAKGAMNAIKGFFGIKSPSREMRKVGVYLGEGLVLGIGDEERDVANEMKSLGEATLGGIEFDAYTAAGVRAAEAFANGIRQVEMPQLGASFSNISSQIRAGALSATPRTRNGVAEDAAGANVTNVESGAIQVITPAEDPEIVASQVLDELVRTL